MRHYRYSSSLVSLLTAGIFLHGQLALANPEGGVISAGGASISSSGAKLDVVQTTDRVVIDWRSFDIGAGEHTEFHQPSSSSMALNRISSGSPTEILGKLSANGNVLILNASGVMFGAGSQVDVNGLVATTSDISNAKFMAGNLEFETPGHANAAVINKGTITAKDAGLVGLVAPNVSNSGVITAKLGTVELASGDQFTVDMYGDGLMNIALSDDVTQQVVENKGTIEAAGGTIKLTAAAGGQVVNSLVNIEGELKAPSVAQKNGKIIISGDVISNTGTINASGANGGEVKIKAKKIAQQGEILADASNGSAGSVDINFDEAYIDSEASRVSATSTTTNGGSIAVKGDTNSHAFISGNYDTSSTNAKGGQIDITAKAGDLKLFGAHVNANGKTGGGNIHIGGEYQGGGTLAHAATTGVNFATTLSANALDSGNGGNIIVWSDETTLFGGTALAKGGSISGNGGQIEISSKDVMKISGNAITDASAANGAAGNLLLDPKNIIIATGGISGGISSFEFVDPNADSGAFGIGGSTYALSTGNVVIADMFDDFGATDAGAVYLFNGATGALISTLRGSSVNDMVGSSPVTVLSNGNFLTSSFIWDNGAIADAGSVTWGSGTTGVAGVVSAANSLVGGNALDSIGRSSINALANGNYVVLSEDWNTGRGAATWGNGATGTSGVVSAANSLVGSNINDQVGYSFTALTNGNYVIESRSWANGGAGNAGAVTWGSGATGVSGVVSAANSLVGTSPADQVGANGVVALTNGNYVVSTAFWNNGGTADVGAVTWGNGLGGTVGAVSAANSLVGSTASDTVGLEGTIALTNGNYVVGSLNWSNGGAAEAGAATWGNGLGGTVGAVSAANSLVGTTAFDHISGNYRLFALTNGNYVVGSQGWDNGGTADVGAATWGNGLGGTVGAVSAANSLIGSTAGDQVGGLITALTNGNYATGTIYWDNGGAADAGATTWGNGTTGTTGVVSAANSLVGSTANDYIGSFVYALTNGNYLTGSINWSNGGAANAGAVAWGNGAGGTVGAISAANAIVGTHANDQVGYTYNALANGNYVINTQYWDNGGTADAGAVTWGNGATGTVGAVSAANSLVGSTAGDSVGDVWTLSNGNYVVTSQYWDDGGTADVGAITWGDGTTGIAGVISNANSIVGTTAGDALGNGGVVRMGGGKYAVFNVSYDNGGSVDSGAVSMLSGSAASTGSISTANSFIGPAANSNLNITGVYDSVNDRMIASFDSLQRAFSISSTPAALGSYDAFADQSTGTVTLDPSFITSVLNAGTAVTLQASNDITVTNAIIANNGGGNGGTFTLQAGRSILINDDITTDNGNLNLFANEKLATGVVNAQRDAGAAVITMGAGAALDAGSGDVVIRLDDGAGKTNLTAGDITLRDITANTILARNNNTTGDIVLTSGALTASAAVGDSIILSSLRNFTNSIGAGALNLSGAARWLVYSTTPGSDTIGGLASGFRRFSCTYGGACPALGAGNGLLYSATPTLTVTPDSIANLAYNDPVPTLTGYSYSLSGYLGGDSATDNVTGALNGSTDYTMAAAAGTYRINYASGSLASAMGYGFTYANNVAAFTAAGAPAGGGGSPAPASVPATFLYVSQTAVPNIVQSPLLAQGFATQETALAQPPARGNSTTTSTATPSYFTTSVNQDGARRYHLLNGWITIAPELAQILGLEQTQI